MISLVIKTSFPPDDDTQVSPSASLSKLIKRLALSDVVSKAIAPHSPTSS